MYSRTFCSLKARKGEGAPSGFQRWRIGHPDWIDVGQNNNLSWVTLGPLRGGVRHRAIRRRCAV
uniref:Uncharacterized protein n=1 Tax=Arundo donax TaxID=35708 RepID=A0A0A9AJ44_ARUDO